ncbi:FAD-dependent oxidoreductase [Parasphingorhabdus sp.]|uniref:FAD-dependent oxidoreductase n=1 Tax=Parasphingorhabdus sp. TaxID=2709688 RepID=UPI003A8ECB6C
MGENRQILISGGGPSGLAAALLFHDMGWEDIVVVEPRSSPEDFEKNKAFNYLVDERGQRLFRKLGFRDLLYDHGVDTSSFAATIIAPDGKAKTVEPPIVAPDRPTAFWTTRRNLLTLLHARIKAADDGRIRLLYETRVQEIIEDRNGSASVIAQDSAGNLQKFQPDVVLACDGMNSAVRQSLGSCQATPDGHFDMAKLDSISAGLHYKVLNLPATFTAADGDVAVADHRMSYIIPSRHKGRRKTCTLFAFPVADADQPRSVNLVRDADHILWTINSAEALLEYLEDAFPQLDMRSLVTEKEAADFVSLKPGIFPAPQYAQQLYAVLGPSSKPMHCMLIGDAAHAFPPDLGLGVNSAFEDLLILAKMLENHPALDQAFQQYEQQRKPESKALAKLVQTVFPEQYNHRPLRTIIWAIGFQVRKGLHKVVPWLVDKPAFWLTQDPDLSFVQILRIKQRTDIIVRGLAIITLAMVIALAFWLA